VSRGKRGGDIGQGIRRGDDERFRELVIGIVIVEGNSPRTESYQRKKKEKCRYLMAIEQEEESETSERKLKKGIKNL